MAWGRKPCSSRCRYRDCCRPQPVKRPYTSSIRRRRSRRGSCILWAQGPARNAPRSLRSERSGPCDASGVAVRGDRARSADHDDRGRDDENGAAHPANLVTLAGSARATPQGPQFFHARLLPAAGAAALSSCGRPPRAEHSGSYGWGLVALQKTLQKQAEICRYAEHAPRRDKVVP